MAVMLNQSPQALSLMNLKNIVKTTNQIQENKKALALTGMAQGAQSLAQSPVVQAGGSSRYATTAATSSSNRNSTSTTTVSGDPPPGVDPSKWDQVKKLISEGRFSDILATSDFVNVGMLSQWIKGGYIKLQFKEGSPVPPGIDPTSWEAVKSKIMSGDFSGVPNSWSVLTNLFSQGTLSMSLPTNDPAPGGDPNPPPPGGDPNPPPPGGDPNPPPPSPEDSPFQARVREFARFRALGRGDKEPPIKDGGPVLLNDGSSFTPGTLPGGGTPISPGSGGVATKPPGDILPVQPPGDGSASAGSSVAGGVPTGGNMPLGSVSSSAIKKPTLEEETFGKKIRSY